MMDFEITRTAEAVSLEALASTDGIARIATFLERNSRQ